METARTIENTAIKIIRGCCADQELDRRTVNIVSAILTQFAEARVRETEAKQAQESASLWLEISEKDKKEAYAQGFAECRELCAKMADYRGWQYLKDSVVGYAEGARDTADLIAQEIRALTPEEKKP